MFKLLRVHTPSTGGQPEPIHPEYTLYAFVCLLFINVPLDAVVAPQEDTSAWRSSGDTEVYVEPTHPKEMLEGLNRLRLNRALCDVVLCCGGQEFPCHRYVLASFSPYFEVIVY